MKVGYLGPFTNSFLKPYLPDLTDEDLKRSPGMGGYGLVPLVLERIRMRKETVVITLDVNLVGERIKRSSQGVTLYALPRRRNKAIRNLFDLERDLSKRSNSRMQARFDSCPLDLRICISSSAAPIVHPMSHHCARSQH
jgi:hypothetical protein